MTGKGPKENAVETALRRRVEACGGVCEKLTSLSRRGFPDRMVILPGGKIFLVELKRPRGGRLSPHQRQRIEKLLTLGVVVQVLCTLDAVDVFIKRAAE
jgi:hypothetical protein